LPILYVIFEGKIKFKMKNKKIFTTFILCVFVINSAQSQSKITLESAIETALKNNNSIKNEKLKADYAKALIATYADSPKANLFGEFGQINSNENDTKFGIAQSFAFPTVYVRQKKLLTEEYNAKLLNSNLKEWEIKKTVTQLFYSYLTLKKQEKLLQKADSLYSKFYEKAALRLQKGESNILEKTTAQNQKNNISMQLRQLKTTIEQSKIEFQLLLNSTENNEPAAEKFKVEFKIDSFKVENNPIIKIFQQQKKIISTETVLQKSKLLPEINLGYNNNSFKGIGLDDSKRFHSAQIGLGIPLFGGSQKAKIKASKIAEKIAENDYQTQVLILKAEYKKLLSQYKSNLEIVNYFEETGNKNAKIIIETANKQFGNGEINYLEFVMIVNQSIAIENAYIEAVKSLNETVISLNYLNSKN
jgi:cobalt-zinc-cadmium resistance protein CzcA